MTAHLFFRGDEMLRKSHLGNAAYCNQHGYTGTTPMLDAATGETFLGCSLCVLQICNSSKAAGPFASYDSAGDAAAREISD